MRPYDYDKNLDYGEGAELRFTISPNQLDVECTTLPDCLECRFDTEQEAVQIALEAANMVGHEVEVEAWVFEGWYGRTLVDSIIIWPNR